MTVRAGSNVVLLGGAGYVGTILTRHLLDLGHSVTVVDNLLYRHGQAIAASFDRSGFSFEHYDIRETDKVRATINGADAVVLLAGLVGDPITKKYPELSTAINKTALTSAVEICRELGVARIVFLSTCSNYGLRADDRLALEDDPLMPLSLYAKHKVEMEQLLLAHADTGPCTTILRLATAFGSSPRMRFDLTVSQFTRELAMGRELLVYDADTWRPYCHVEDIAAAVATVLEAPDDVVRGQVFNVGRDDNNFTKRMLVDQILQILGDGKVAYGEGGGDPRNYRVDFAKVRRTLSFEPKWGIPETIRRLVQAVQCGLYDDVEGRKAFYGNYSIDSCFHEVGGAKAE